MLKLSFWAVFALMVVLADLFGSGELMILAAGFGAGAFSWHNLNELHTQYLTRKFARRMAEEDRR